MLLPLFLGKLGKRTKLTCFKIILATLNTRDRFFKILRFPV